MSSLALRQNPGAKRAICRRADRTRDVGALGEQDSDVQPAPRCPVFDYSKAGHAHHLRAAPSSDTTRGPSRRERKPPRRRTSIGERLSSVNQARNAWYSVRRAALTKERSRCLRRIHRNRVLRSNGLSSVSGRRRSYHHPPRDRLLPSPERLKGHDRAEPRRRKSVTVNVP